MNGLLLVSVVLAPLILVAFATGRHGTWLAAIAPLPAVGVASFGSSPEVVVLEGVLLGVRLGLDDTGRVFLMSSALVWIVAAVYAAGSLGHSPNAARFRVFFQLAMTGNFALILAQDMVTFFLGFTLMGLSAYGLVAHQQSVSARRAGRLYLGWTILGEVSLFCALVLFAAGSGGLEFEGLRTATPSHLAVGLVVIGLGIKLALPGLHVWLPLTYAAAPGAGVAVLSGPMISAGLLGLMRFLPPGNDALIPWGEFLIATGIVGTAFGVAAGLLQRSPRVVLGYSSISKMGVLTSGFGIALAHPDTVSLLLPALTLYAVHHLMVKSALFIGIDILDRGKARAWVMTGLVLLGLALIGAPLTSGALAKATLVNGLPGSAAWFGSWLTVTALATTLLMGRLLYLLWYARTTLPKIDNFALTSWSALIVFIGAAPFFLGTPQELISGGLPIALGAFVSVLVWRYPPERLTVMVGRISPGNALYLLSSRIRLTLVARTQTWARRVGQVLRTRKDRLWQTIIPLTAGLLQARLTAPQWTWVGTLWVTVIGLAVLTISTGY